MGWKITALKNSTVTRLTKQFYTRHRAQLPAAVAPPSPGDLPSGPAVLAARLGRYGRPWQCPPAPPHPPPWPGSNWCRLLMQLLPPGWWRAGGLGRGRGGQLWSKGCPESHPACPGEECRRVEGGVSRVSDSLTSLRRPVRKAIAVKEQFCFWTSYKWGVVKGGGGNSHRQF